MRSLLKDKRGDIFQVMFLLILLFIVAAVGLIFLVLTTQVNNFWDDSGLLEDSATAMAAIDTMQEIAPRTTDYAVLFLFVGMTVGTTIAAVRTNFNAITIILFILLTFIAVIEAAGFVNMYQGLAQNSEVAAVAQDLTWTAFFFSKYLPLLTIGLCALILILMFGKSGSDIVT